MKLPKIFYLFVFIFAFLSVGVYSALAQTEDPSSASSFGEVFYRARIIEVYETTFYTEFEMESFLQTLQIEFLEGPLEGQLMDLDYSDRHTSDSQLVAAGDKVVIIAQTMNGEVTYALFAPYRLPMLWILVGLFVVVLLSVAGWRGLTSLFGLAFTFFVIVKGIAPLVLQGYSPLWVSWGGAILIAVVSLYISHGFKRLTTLSLVSTLATLHVALFFSGVFVMGARLFGLGTEEAVYLTFGFGSIDMQGLLLGAIVIGTLGILDDVTTSQTAAVAELHSANSRLSFKELYRRGLSVGRVHIASLVNTLALAYVGVSFPSVLLFVDAQSPLWVSLNHEYIAEEIVRTLVGSLSLILAVPISTALAAWAYGRAKHRS